MFSQLPIGLQRRVSDPVGTFSLVWWHPPLEADMELGHAVPDPKRGPVVDAVSQSYWSAEPVAIRCTLGLAVEYSELCSLVLPIVCTIPVSQCTSE